MSFMKLKKPFIIAEAGVNHNGNLKKAYELIDIATEAEADAVKFQTFKTYEITSEFVGNTDYISKSTSQSNLSLIKNLELKFSDFKLLKNYAERKGIMFMSTPDGEESLNFLCDELDVKMVKVGSTEVTNIEYLKKIAEKNKPIIFSTGMSNLNEIKNAYNVLKPNKNEICVLHCTSEYPAPDNEINLQAMLTIKNELNCSVGFSDHSLGNEASIIAVSMGADIIEKHFTIDKNLEGPDHKASLDPQELKIFINSLNRSTKMLGDGIKKPTLSEIKNMGNIRRGIVLAEDMKKGQKIQKKHLDFKRPFVGINPSDANLIIGRILKLDLKKDQPILWEYLK